MTKGSNNNYKSAGPKNQFFIHFLLVRRIFAMHFAREIFFLENVRDIRAQRLMLMQYTIKTFFKINNAIQICLLDEACSESKMNREFSSNSIS